MQTDRGRKFSLLQSPIAASLGEGIFHEFPASSCLKHLVLALYCTVHFVRTKRRMIQKHKINKYKNLIHILSQRADLLSVNLDYVPWFSHGFHNQCHLKLPRSAMNFRTPQLANTDNEPHPMLKTKEENFSSPSFPEIPILKDTEERRKKANVSHFPRDRPNEKEKTRLKLRE